MTSGSRSPTVEQMRYLRRLGYRGLTPETRGEAAELIDEFKRKRRRQRARKGRHRDIRVPGQDQARARVIARERNYGKVVVVRHQTSCAALRFQTCDCGVMRGPGP